LLHVGDCSGKFNYAAELIDVRNGQSVHRGKRPDRINGFTAGAILVSECGMIDDRAFVRPEESVLM
jgi:hypothetical protein